MHFARSQCWSLGYNVETIKLRRHRFSCRSRDKITLWDCGGQPSVRSLWPYHYSDTSLLLWLINAHDRTRLDANIQLLSQTLTDPTLCQVPVLIILYHSPFYRVNAEKRPSRNLITNLEVAFRFLASLSRARASLLQWQVISVTLNEKTHGDFKKIEQSFKELMCL